MEAKASANYLELRGWDQIIECREIENYDWVVECWLPSVECDGCLSDPNVERPKYSSESKLKSKSQALRMLILEGKMPKAEGSEHDNSYVPRAKQSKSWIFKCYHSIVELEF